MKTLLSLAAVVLVVAGIGFLTVRTVEAVERVVNGYHHRLQKMERTLGDFPERAGVPRI